MPKVLVLFYSRTGNTAALADAIAAGADSVKFTEVEMRRVEDRARASEIEANAEWNAARTALTKKYPALESVESLAQYDALILGSPVRQGMMSEELKQVLDQANVRLQRGALADRVGSAFAPVSAANGGHDVEIMPMLIPMMRLGMILVPPGGLDPRGVDPAGAELAAAQRQGARVAKVAGWVRHAKSHEAHGHRH